MASNVRLENMEKFGYREIEAAADLMKAYANGKAPAWFHDDGVTVEFNPNSGNVFLVNSDFQVLMLDDDSSLYMFYTLSYHGSEGGAQDLYTDFISGNIGTEDYEELADIFDQEGMTAEADEVRA